MSKRKYKTDTERGTRTIVQIDGLPSKDLTDEEFVKQFYHRFGATALVLAYTDETGAKQVFGRLKYGKNPGYWYRQLLHVVDAYLPTIMPRESIIEWMEMVERKLMAGNIQDAATDLRSIRECIKEDMEMHRMNFEKEV